LLTIVIPTLNAARTIEATLAALAAARESGLAFDVVVSDGGSTDATPALARAAGAKVVTGPKGRGRQLSRGAGAATGTWLLFLHADTRLAPGWSEAVRAFRAAPDNANKAGYFDLVLDDGCRAARRIEALVRLRCRLFALPYGDQGLLVARATYDAVGRFRDLPLMEDVDLVRRLGRARMIPLEHAAITSAERYRCDGWWRRPLQNLACLALYFLGVPPRRLVRIYR
jgi:rSAM/selenodomain-associated transferase 2